MMKVLYFQDRYNFLSLVIGYEAIAKINLVKDQVVRHSQYNQFLEAKKFLHLLKVWFLIETVLNN